MHRKYIVFIILLILLLLVPVVVRNPYDLHILIIILIASTVSLGAGLLLYTGMISLCQASIVCVGCYTSALLVMQCGLSFWLALPLSGLATAIVGVGLGFPSFRLKGLYFLLMTWAMNEIITLGIKSGPEVLGGHVGISAVPVPNPIVIPGLVVIEFTTKMPYYYLILVITLLTCVVSYRVYHSHFGRVLHMVHTNDVLARSLGVNVAKYKILIFAVVCFLTGLAGSFMAHYYQLATTHFFGVWPSIYYLVYAQVGGFATIFGPIIGAAVFVTLPELFAELVGYTPIIFGSALIVSIFFLPEGIESLPSIVMRKLRRGKANGAA